MLCDLGDPGWGDPRFPHSTVLLCSHCVWQVMLTLFVGFSLAAVLFGLPYQHPR